MLIPKSRTVTGIPDIHEIWVLRNPFVKSHSNYRITIFNLFRSTPGYSEDILIDASAPGYGERRQLRDRIVEPEGAPVVRHTSIEPLATRIDASVGENPNELQRPLPQTIQSEIVIGSERRRKGPRRRIVDLARDESPPSNHPQSSIRVQEETIHPEASSDLKDDVPTWGKPALLPPLHIRSDVPSSQPPKTITATSQLPAGVSDKGRSLVTEIQGSNINGDAYRQKIEALKSEVGSNWLSVFSEEGWNQHQSIQTPSSQFEHVGALRPEAPAFRASSGILSGGRTIG